MASEAQLDLLLRMPMRFSALVVETTNRCNARCGMCYQSSGPKGSDVLGAAKQNPVALLRCVREALAIPNLHPKFHLAGGEAFLDVDACIALIRDARDCGYLDVTATTNAYWARKPERAREVVHSLQQAGMTALEISWDHWHTPYIDARAIDHCLLACADAGIDTNLRVLTTTDHSIEEALACLNPDALASTVRITSGPVFPTGRAGRRLDPTTIYRSRGGSDGVCHGSLNLTVNAFGNVFPCCAGLDQTRDYLFGNIRDRSIVEIAQGINRDPVARVLVFLGPSALVPIAQAAGVSVISADAANICHLCWRIFSDPHAVNAIRDQFAQRASASLDLVAHELEMEIAEAQT